MKVKSIRFRLTAWYAGLLTAVLVALVALLFVHLKTYLEDTLLEVQARRARQIAGTLVANAGLTGEAYMARQVEALYAPEKSERFIRITAGDGRLVYLCGAPLTQAFDPASVPPAPVTGLEEARRIQTLAAGPSLLIAAVRVVAGGHPYLVEVGTSAAPVEMLFRHLLGVLGCSLPVVALLATSGGYLLIRRTLRPVDEIASKAEQISQHNLSERLPVPATGDELESLSLSLNRMIQRLDDAFLNSKRFVADASHELRTPLTVLRGELEALAHEEGLPTSERERLGGLLEEAERLSMIVERLFALSRLDAGEAQAEWVHFDLAELTTTTAGQMALLAEDRRIVVTCDAVSPVWVDGDRGRLKQVVVNLLDNAIKYTPEGGAVHLRVAAVDRQAILEINDTGIGIPEDALPHIFDRFFRVDPSRSRQPDGSGLGLSIVKSICNAHGGVVEVESALNRGSRFRIKLPLAA